VSSHQLLAASARLDLYELWTAADSLHKFASVGILQWAAESVEPSSPRQGVTRELDKLLASRRRQASGYQCGEDDCSRRSGIILQNDQQKPQW
jgi:hypothetical protein